MNTKTKKALIRALIVAIFVTITEILSDKYFSNFTLRSTSFDEIFYAGFFWAVIGTFTFLLNNLVQSFIPLIHKDDLHEDVWGWIGAVTGGILALVLIYLFLTVGSVVS